MECNGKGNEFRKKSKRIIDSLSTICLLLESEMGNNPFSVPVFTKVIYVTTKLSFCVTKESLVT